MFTIGGWGGSLYFSELLRTASGRAAFAQDIVAYLNKYGFAGVDIDWEYPNNSGIGCNKHNSADSGNFLLFLAELRSLVGNKKLITAAATGSGFLDANGNPLSDASGFARYLDYLTIMNYDIYGPTWSTTTGPNAPLYDTCSPIKDSASSALAYWTKAGFPACKLLLGVPAYGYAYTTKSSTLSAQTYGKQKTYMYQASSSVAPKGDANDVYSSGKDICGHEGSGYSGTWTYDTMISGGILSSDGQTGLKGFKRYWDNCSETPFLFNSAKKYFISYDDSQSIQQKAEYVRSKGMAGINIFDSSGFNAAVYKVARSSLNASSKRRRSGLHFGMRRELASVSTT